MFRNYRYLIPSNEKFNIKHDYENIIEPTETPSRKTVMSQRIDISSNIVAPSDSMKFIQNFYCCVLNDQIFYNSNSFLNLAPQFFYSIKHGFSHSPPSGHSIKFESIYSILDKQVKLLKIAVFSHSTFNYKLLFKLEKIKLQRYHKSNIILSITSRVNAFVNIVSQNPMFQ